MQGCGNNQLTFTLDWISSTKLLFASRLSTSGIGSCLSWMWTSDALTIRFKGPCTANQRLQVSARNGTPSILFTNKQQNWSNATVGVQGIEDLFTVNIERCKQHLAAARSGQRLPRAVGQTPCQARSRSPNPEKGKVDQSTHVVLHLPWLGWKSSEYAKSTQIQTTIKRHTIAGSAAASYLHVGKALLWQVQGQPTNSVVSLSLHHAQAQDLYESTQEKSRESCREEREDKSEARAWVRGRLAQRRPLHFRWQVIPAHAPLRRLWLWNRPLQKGSGKGIVQRKKDHLW